MSQGAGVQMGPEMVPDVDLLTLVQTGDQQAFRSIYDRHVDAVALAALRFLGSREFSEDAVQATFIVFWQRSNEVVLADTSLMPWLATVCRLQCRNIQKKEARRRHIPLDSVLHLANGEKSLEDRAVDAALIRSMDHEISKMSTIDAEIFRLCLVEGFSYDGAAETLGVTRSVVRNRLSRLKLKLRAFLTARA